jgi:heme/copper-type cytochrome/quinol oxidase subunit 3
MADTSPGAAGGFGGSSPLASTAAGLSRAQEEAAFYHEAALNTAWTGVRLAIGVVTSGLGAFVFAFFYLRSVNNYGLWYPKGFGGPSGGLGATIMALIVVSAGLQSLGVRQLKAGRKQPWFSAALAALVLGVAAFAILIAELTSLSFQPGANAFASVFVGASAVFAVLLLGMLVWLEITVMSSRHILPISFVEQPPTFAEAAEVQRFQASLSAFTLFWNFIAVVALVLWVLFYLVH